MKAAPAPAKWAPAPGVTCHGPPALPHPPSSLLSSPQAGTVNVTCRPASATAGTGKVSASRICSAGAAQFTRADQVEIQSVDWLVHGWLARDSLAGLVGPSGACKSFLAIDWACRIATGTAWGGRDVSKGAVFVLAGEGRNGLRKRIEGWSRHNSVSIAGAPLYLSANMPALSDPLTAAELAVEIDRMAEEMFFSTGIDPALIVIDTVARAMAGKNENSAQDVGELVASMDRLREMWGATVLAVHHTGHKRPESARGSSAFYAALDSEAVLTPGKGNALRLSATKCKDWEPPWPIGLKSRAVEIELPGVEEIASTLVLEECDAMPCIKGQEDQVFALKARGLGIREIASQTGLSKSKVGRMIKEAKSVWEQDFDGGHG